MLRRLAVSIGLVFALVGLLATPAVADHGVAHNGETAEISKSDGLVQGEVVTVTGMGYAPGSTLTVVQCFIFPASGPTDCELSNYGQFTGTVGDDGTAAVDYEVNIVDGQCDAATPCFIVVSDGIGPSANGVGMEVTFADGAPATTAAPTTSAAPETTAAPTTTAAPATTAAAAEADADAEEDAAADEAAAADDDSDDDGGGNGWILPVVIIVAVLAAVGAFLAKRNKG